tara:strand:- start:81 stop:497 length:417 start_codon:yes stop_codon:yes gene_type:complete
MPELPRAMTCDDIDQLEMEGGEECEGGECSAANLLQRIDNAKNALEDSARRKEEKAKRKELRVAKPSGRILGTAAPPLITEDGDRMVTSPSLDFEALIRYHRIQYIYIPQLRLSTFFPLSYFPLLLLAPSSLSDVCLK